MVSGVRADGLPLNLTNHLGHINLDRMTIVNLAQAKAQLSKLVDAAARGQSIVIARRNVPVVRLERVRATRGKGGYGALRGKIELSADFDAPLRSFAPYRR